MKMYFSKLELFSEAVHFYVHTKESLGEYLEEIIIEWKLKKILVLLKIEVILMKDYTDLKNHRIPLKDAIPLKMPFTLFVDPSNYCNFKCSFCPRNNDDFQDYAGTFKHMTLSLFEKIVGDLKEFPSKLKVLRLFYLGEPLLCPDFLPILQLAVKEKISERIEISTNASLLTEDVSKQILNISKEYDGNLYIRVSIYSVIPEKNKQITKSKIPIENIYRNVAKFKEYRDSFFNGGGV